MDFPHRFSRIAKQGCKSTPKPFFPVFFRGCFGNPKNSRCFSGAVFGIRKIPGDFPGLFLASQKFPVFFRSFSLLLASSHKKVLSLPLQRNFDTQNAKASRSINDQFFPLFFRLQAWWIRVVFASGGLQYKNKRTFIDRDSNVKRRP